MVVLENSKEVNRWHGSATLSAFSQAEGSAASNVKVVVAASFTVTIKRRGASEAVRFVIVGQVIREDDLVWILTALDGSMTVLNIADPSIEEALPLKFHGCQQPQELAKKVFSLLLTLREAGCFGFGGGFLKDHPIIFQLNMGLLKMEPLSLLPAAGPHVIVGPSPLYQKGRVPTSSP
ncbi:hypothetical protein Cgig2_012850 [Carnegiea gigantea]|uniref:Uncharacterized protein n=1 Tax=Carnegiea gigantea TaxID=171969 RepID=A0A9Q1GUP6_9CARY|nr:hypothetical protein Cgig2_012850 [Carnegiea gigantea]